MRGDVKRTVAEINKPFRSTGIYSCFNRSFKYLKDLYIVTDVWGKWILAVFGTFKKKMKSSLMFIFFVNNNM